MVNLASAALAAAWSMSAVSVHDNHEVAKDGWCWRYRKYAPGDVVLEELEMAAQEAKRGLWMDPHPVPPWQWRKHKHKHKQ